MIDRVVCIGGPPGSGKSTAGRAAARELELSFHSAGEIFRAQAAQRGLDLAAYSRYAEAHEEVDRALDRAMLELARPGYLLDGRITGPLCRRERIPAHVIVITAREEVRAGRLVARDGGTPEAALAAIRIRQASERDRYHRYYGIDLDRELPDVSIDSSELSPDEVRRRVVGFLTAGDRSP